jgi:hypothetical protein
MGGRFWSKMLCLANQMVAAGCRKKDLFHWAEYERLVQAAFDVYAKADVCQGRDTDLATSWTENILLALCFEADRTLASALIRPAVKWKSDLEVELRQMAVCRNRSALGGLCKTKNNISQPCHYTICLRGQAQLSAPSLSSALRDIV